MACICIALKSDQLVPVVPQNLLHAIDFLHWSRYLGFLFDKPSVPLGSEELCRWRLYFLSLAFPVRISAKSHDGHVKLLDLPRITYWLISKK
jgi:hypothetical protein